MCDLRSRPLVEPGPEPYTGCSRCIPYREHLDSLLRRLPLSANAMQREVPAVDADGIDWNDYYWGYHWTDDNRSERRVIVRPLPLSITNRISLELYEHILGFLLWERKDLYNCALVCRAWHHRSQLLLYSCVAIEGRTAYDAVVLHSSQNTRSLQYLTNTHVLEVSSYHQSRHRFPAQQQQYWSAVPLVLGNYMRTLECLRYAEIRPPYHTSFPFLVSCFSALVHLTLVDFQLISFLDLRTMVCALKNLRELELELGGLMSSSETASIAPGASSIRAPRLKKLHLNYLDHGLLSGIASWVTLTDICHVCTGLDLAARDLEGRHFMDAIISKLSTSLVTLSYDLLHPDCTYLHDAVNLAEGLTLIHG